MQITSNVIEYKLQTTRNLQFSYGSFPKRRTLAKHTVVIVDGGGW